MPTKASPRFAASPLPNRQLANCVGVHPPQLNLGMLCEAPKTLAQPATKPQTWKTLFGAVAISQTVKTVCI